MSDMDTFRNQQLQDPEFREYYLEEKMNSDIAKAIVSARLNKNLTQKEAAELTGIAQADISRLERCNASPTLKTLKKFAKGLGLAVKIEFIPVESLLPDMDE